MAKVLIGGDREPDMVAALARFDGIHRRREIANVEASFEALRNPGAQQVDLQAVALRSEEHTSELQSRGHLVCRLLLEKKNRRRIGGSLPRHHSRVRLSPYGLHLE